VAYALGQGLGLRYQKELKLLGLVDAKLREGRRRELERTLRDPALTYLRLGAGSQTDSAEYVEGLIAFYERRYEDAVKKAQAAFHRVGWLYEALRLEGDAEIQIAEIKRAAGDAAGARARYAAAGEAYRRALGIAHSDDALWVGECQRLYHELVAGVDKGDFPKAISDQAVQACDRALVVNPDNVDALTNKSDVIMKEVEAKSFRGEDCRDAAKAALDPAERALAKLETLPTLLVVGIGWAFVAKECEVPQGIDPRPSMMRAVAALKRSIEVQPTGKGWRGLGRAYRGLAEAARVRGGDAIPFYDQSADSYRRAIAVDGQGDGNLGITLENRAEYELSRGIDPRPTVAESVAAFTRALKGAKEATFYNSLASAQSARAVYEYFVGEDPIASTEEAVRSYRLAIEVNPKMLASYINLADALRTEIDYLLAQRRDPSGAIARARQALADGAKAGGTGAYGLDMGEAGLDLENARWAHERGQPVEPLLGAGLAAANRAIRRNPKDVDTIQIKAELQARQAEWASGAHQVEALAQARRTVDELLAINATQAEAFTVRGRLQLIGLRQIAAPEQQAAAAAALASFERAFQINPLLRGPNRQEYQQALQLAGRAQR
jgi:tetratricopeptide (TPR) repeat protein